jgi:hypothetical protein
MEYVAASLIVLILLGVAGFYGRRQWQMLRSLRSDSELAPEDRGYVLAQCWRRLLGCALMVAFAGMLAGWYVFGLNQQAEELRQQGQEATIRAEAPGEFDQEQRHSFHVFSTYWIIAVLLLFAIVILAFADMLAIRRYGLRHLRRLQSDRRAALEREVAIFRNQRNGHG